MKVFSCFLVEVLQLCLLRVGLVPSQFSFQCDVGPGDSPQQVLHFGFPLVKLLKTRRGFSETFCICFSVSTPHAGNDVKGNPASCLRPPVSLRNSLVSLSPDSQLLPGPEWGGCPEGSGCRSQLPALRVSTLQPQPLQSSLPQQLGTAGKQRMSALNWTFLALLDRSAGLLQVPPYHP